MKAASWTAGTLVVLLYATPLLAAPSDEGPLALSPEMIVFLDENLTPHASPLYQLHELLDLVFDDGELGFTYSTATYSAAEAFEHRHGSCLSFTNMFIAMARHLGFVVGFREADTVPVWNQRGAVFTVNKHMNVAVDIGSRRFVVDLAPELRELEIGGTVVSDDRGLAHFHNNLAVERLVAGDLEGASMHANHALELAPDAPFLWTTLGVVRTRHDDLEGATAAYSRALELQPDHLPAMSNLALAYTRLNAPEQAAHYRRAAHRFREQNPYYHYQLGLKASAVGDLQSALERYRTAVELKRQEHRFHVELADLLTRLGRADQAEYHRQQASLYAPDAS